MIDPADPLGRRGRVARVLCAIAIGVLGTGLLLVVAEQHHIRIRGIVWSFLALAASSITVIAIAAHAILVHLRRPWRAPLRRSRPRRAHPLPVARVTSCRRRAP